MVSVIIPNYNHAPYLRERIESVLAQTCQDFELILLDDCSTDGSREVIESFRNHPKVSRIVFNSENSGSVFRQWQKGIELASGTYVWIAESDDWAHPDFLKTMVPVLVAHPAMAFVYADSFVVEDGVQQPKTFGDIRNETWSTGKWSHSYINQGRAEIKERLAQSCTVNNASVVLFRKQALLDADVFDLTFRLVGDWYCYLKLCLDYEMGYVATPLSYYREHAANASKKLNRNHTFISEYFKLFNWMEKNLDFVPRTQVLGSFKYYIQHALFKNWDRARLRLYRQLWQTNPKLFLQMNVHNLIASVKK